MWCLPDWGLVPEMCGEPLYMIFLGSEIWLMLSWLQLLPAFFVIAGIKGFLERDSGR